MPSFNSITASECAAKIQNATNIAVLSGAGMSTAAGVPDFRGPKGLYVTRAYDPETVFEIHYFDKNPEPFYQFSRDFLSMLRTITPTFTHTFLATLENQYKKNITLITQNIDGLHQRAGSHNVLPIHGDYETSTCRHCGKRLKTSAELEALMETMDVPRCSCGGVFKPDVVFFGENVRYLHESAAAAADSDVMLVLGSSLTVYPAASLPYEADGSVIIVNKGPVSARAGENFYLADTTLDEFFNDVSDALVKSAK